MKTLLEESLSPLLRRQLVNSLNTNERWNLIVEGLTTYRIPVILNINKMNTMVRKGMSPADWILEELFDRMCSFDEFCTMLREFDLLEELSLLTPAVPVVIEEQPGEGDNTMQVENGGKLELKCVASGIPRPSYQWYYENTLLEGQTTSSLTVSPFSEEEEGVYWCQVSQQIRSHMSQHRSTEVMVTLNAQRPYLVVDLPRLRTVGRGVTLLLQVQAEGYPLLSYEWFRSDCESEDVMPNIVLPESSNTLQIKNAKPGDEGLYCCRVYNEAGEVFSGCCNVAIFERPPNYAAQAKVALLIGNEEYVDPELQGLRAPSNDVATLAEILESLDFHVIALHNLTRTEMYNAFRWFCSLLPENAYAFFYFAGHGFSKLASKFMMPVDCLRNQVKLANSLCEEQLTQILAQGSQLQLLVMLFDCCLIESRDLSIGRTEFHYDLGNCNIVLGTATRNHQNAYESDPNGNGMFVDHLKAHLSKQIPIIEVLRKNQRDFRDKQQQPTIFFSGADNCSLTDPVLEDSELREIIQKEIAFPSYKQEIYFVKTNEHFMVDVRKHRHHFLNSIDLEFPKSFNHNFTVTVNSEDTEIRVKGKVVTILNVQKVKTTMCVTVFISGVRQVGKDLSSGLYDSCVFSLDCGLIHYGQLWHKLTPLQTQQLL